MHFRLQLKGFELRSHFLKKDQLAGCLSNMLVQNCLDLGTQMLKALKFQKACFNTFQSLLVFIYGLILLLLIISGSTHNLFSVVL
jgi:hypothetical protein